MAKILVCGSRYWNNWPVMVRALQLHVTADDTVLHGGCRGADSMAGKIAREQIGTEVRVFIPDWKKFGLSAGPRRNREMLDESEKVIAFHDDLSSSKGTKDVVEEAIRRGLPIVLVTSNETN